MREPRTFHVFGFATTHEALDAEALLDDMGVDVVPIPTPKGLGAHCGIALRVPLDETERAQRYLENAGITPASTTQIEDV
jgi:hypothetical protein